MFRITSVALSIRSAVMHSSTPWKLKPPVPRLGQGRQLNKAKESEEYIEDPQQLSFFDQIEPQQQPHPVIWNLEMWIYRI